MYESYVELPAKTVLAAADITLKKLDNELEARKAAILEEAMKPKKFLGYPYQFTREEALRLIRNKPEMMQKAEAVDKTQRLTAFALMQIAAAAFMNDKEAYVMVAASDMWAIATVYFDKDFWLPKVEEPAESAA